MRHPYLTARVALAVLASLLGQTALEAASERITRTLPLDPWACCVL